MASGGGVAEEGEEVSRGVVDSYAGQLWAL